MKKFFIALLVFILILVGSIALLWFNLDWILTERNITFVKDRYKIPLSWQSLDVSVRNRGLSTKDFNIQSKELCFDWDQPSVHICLKHLSLEATVTVLFQKPFVHIEGLYLDGETSLVQVKLEPASQAKDDPAPTAFWPSLDLPSLQEMLGSYIDMIHLETIRSASLVIPKANLQREDLLVEGSATLNYEDLLLKLSLKTDVQKAEKKLVAAEMKSSLHLQNYKLAADLDLKLPTYRTEIQSELSWSQSLELTVTADSQFKVPTRTRLTVKNAPQKWTMDVHSDIDLKRWDMGRGLLKNCQLDLQLSPEGKAQNLNFPCDVELVGIEKLGRRHLPSTLDIQIRNKNTLAKKADLLQIESEVLMTSKTESLLDVNAEGSGILDLNLKTFALERIEVPNFLAEFNIVKVKSWQDIFKKNNVPLPAPLNALDGPLRLKVNVQSPDLKKIVSQIELTSDLQGAGQKLNTASKAEVRVQMDTHEVRLNGEANLNEIAFDLPYIGLEAPPQFMPDKRFVKDTTPKPKKPSKWKFVVDRFEVRTPQKPILVSTRLLEVPVPVRLQFVYENAKLSGRVALDPFNLELFKKKFRIEKMNLIRHPYSKVMDVDGEMTYRTSEVRVSLLVIGTTESPRIEFLSDPPLSREQIISIVLFNKSLQQITDEEKAVAGQLNQAMLTGAFGVFSLLFLSKTPIESIYYDPASKSYTARVKLDDQTSLSLGSNFDTSQQFQLRRRLGGAWSVVTELQKTQDADDVVTTLIEWFNRF